MAAAPNACPSALIPALARGSEGACAGAMWHVRIGALGLVVVLGGQMSLAASGTVRVAQRCDSCHAWGHHIGSSQGNALTAVSPIVMDRHRLREIISGHVSLMRHGVRVVRAVMDVGMLVIVGDPRRRHANLQLVQSSLGKCSLHAHTMVMMLH